MAGKTSSGLDVCLANQIGMNENGGFSSTAQGWAEAEVRQPLIPPGLKPAQNDFGRGDGISVSPSPQHVKKSIYCANSHHNILCRLYDTCICFSSRPSQLTV